MSPSRIYLHFLRDILSHTNKAIQFVDGMSEINFIEDEKTVFAVVRALEVIGEASKNIPAEVREKYPQVPWREMGRMRDKLIHHYFGINLETVWQTIVDDLPLIQSEIRIILNQEENK